MKKRWVAVVTLIGIFSLGLIACKNENSEVEAEVQQEDLAAIEEQQNKIIAEYAAGVLMKYNAGSNSRVLRGEKLLIEEAKEEVKRAQEEKRQQLFEEYEKQKNDEEGKNTEVSTEKDGKIDGNSTESSRIEYLEDIASFIGTPSFSITYSGYEVTDSYLEDLVSFTIDAREGKVLLVTKFMVSNIGGQEEELDILSVAPEFKLKLGDKVTKAQQTMLLDDLAMYKGSFDNGETREMVLIFEIANETASSLGNMELSIKTAADEGRMLLEGGENILPIVNENVVTTEEVGEEVAEEDIDGDLEEVISEEAATEEGATVTTVGSNNNVIVEPAE